MAKRDVNTEPGIDRNIDFNTWIGEQLTSAVELGASDVVLSTDVEHRQMRCEIRINGSMRFHREARGDAVASLITVFRRNAELATAGSPTPKEAVYPVKMPSSGQIEMARAVVFRGHQGQFIAQLRLPAEDRVVSLDDLKLGEENYSRITELLTSPGRMIMVAGPMGSGKSTSVHGMINYISRDKTKTIWTIEDPVERTLEGTFQLQADENNGYGFAEFLPHMVRSDYDTLFIGEIRDKQTAAAAVRQSKAGRQIITTIHSNDNIVALLRLIELAEDSPLAVLDSVKGVISQRLVPTLNPEWDGKDPAMKYTGRRPINEVLMVDRDIVQAFMDGESLAHLRKLSDDTGKSTTFFDDAARLVDAGLTDWEAVGGVLGEVAVAQYVEARQRGEDVSNASAPIAAETFDAAQGGSAQSNGVPSALAAAASTPERPRLNSARGKSAQTLPERAQRPAAAGRPRTLPRKGFSSSPRPSRQGVGN